MAIYFPTCDTLTPTGSAYPAGKPTRAGHCQCLEGPLQVDRSDTCLRCGHYSRRTVDETWSDRARVVALRAGRQQPVLKAAA